MLEKFFNLAPILKKYEMIKSKGVDYEKFKYQEMNLI